MVMWGILPIEIGWLQMLAAFTKSILGLSMSARGLGLQSDLSNNKRELHYASSFIFPQILLAF